MESLLERGEKLDDLVQKSEHLGNQSKAFYKTARKQNSCCEIMWSQWKSIQNGLYSCFPYFSSLSLEPVCPACSSHSKHIHTHTHMERTDTTVYNERLGRGLISHNAPHLQFRCCLRTLFSSEFLEGSYECPRPFLRVKLKTGLKKAWRGLRFMSPLCLTLDSSVLILNRYIETVH